MKSGKSLKIAIYGFAILLLPPLAYLITRAVVYYLPMENNLAILTACIITTILILGVPYLMLKILFHNAHLDRGEKELKAKDLPKHAEKPRNFIHRRSA